jgi:3',5'-cyclic AMP phosphodiesterase CpdA
MKRLAHISDLHFGATDDEVVERVADELHEFEPHLLVVTGDLTQRGKRRQYEAACRFLDQLPYPRLVVPGNHDIAPLYRPFSRAYHPFARYLEYVSPLLDTVYADDTMLVIGMNSVHPLRWKEGRVTFRQLEWLAEHAATAGDRRLIVATHHPLVETAVGPSAGRVRGKTELHRMLERLSVELVLAGHLHETHSGPAAMRLGGSESLLVVQASTATSTRLRGHANAYNRLLVDEKRVCIDVRVVDHGIFATGLSTEYVRRDGVWQSAAGGGVLEP